MSNPPQSASLIGDSAVRVFVSSALHDVSVEGDYLVGMASLEFPRRAAPRRLR